MNKIINYLISCSLYTHQITGTVGQSTVSKLIIGTGHKYPCTVLSGNIRIMADIFRNHIRNFTVIRIRHFNAGGKDINSGNIYVRAGT
ncbi:hypothetical protein D3C76_1546270 [compost metagenome]